MIDILNDDIINNIIDMRTDDIERDIKKIENQIIINNILVATFYKKDIKPLARIFYSFLDTTGEDSFNTEKSLSVIAIICKNINRDLLEKKIYDLLYKMIRFSNYYNYLWFLEERAFYRIYKDENSLKKFVIIDNKQLVIEDEDEDEDEDEYEDLLEEDEDEDEDL